MIGGYIDEYGIVNTIDNVSLIFNDETIDTYSNYQYKIFYDLISTVQKKKALKEMFGTSNDDYIINSEIRSYMKVIKDKHFIYSGVPGVRAARDTAH